MTMKRKPRRPRYRIGIKSVGAAPAADPVDEPVRPVDGCKVLGTAEKPHKKVWAMTELSAEWVEKSEGVKVLKIKGYANTKGEADRYGDVPTVFTPLRNYVYELTQFKKNPVMLLDHDNSVRSIAGSFVVLREDERGLYFEAEFSQSDYPPIKHARTVYAEGHGKALSISGRFYFENKDASEQLTYVDLFEISLVGVGADPNALTARGAPAPEPAAATVEPEVDEDEKTFVAAVEELMGRLDAAETEREAEAKTVAAIEGLAAEADGLLKGR